MEQDYRVICPDVVGRGHSDWLADKSDYTYPLYVNDLAMLLARIDAERIDWVGTSMGGLIGIFMASYPGTPIHKMVINDIGPRIPVAGLQRVATYVGQLVTYDSIERMERFSAPSPPFWQFERRAMAAYDDSQFPTIGRWPLCDGLDPGIAENFKTLDLKDIDLWPFWDRIHCPTLVLRGAFSDVLDHADAVAMTERGPKAKLIEFPGMGHAPALMADDQIAVVRDWLLAD
ncbi:MAG: alpha/beta hydrolase [Candidatus Competibacteraceae bacterium]|nr:alpha/beta hydrolase [Candidatus Competibacteraceae bacterium]